MIDAVIVGAGLSGLVCARRLVAAGRRVIVVEAQDRVGGRLRSARFGAATVDLGGAWVSVGQPRLLALAAELGVATVEQHRHGGAIVVGDDDAPRRLPGRVLAALAVRRQMKRIDRLARDDVRDTCSLDDWLAREVGHREARAEIALHAELTYAATPADLSLASYLAMHAACGGFGDPRVELPGGGRERRFAGGAHGMAAALAAPLGDAVRLAEPVRAIDDDGARVRVVTARGEHVAARAVLAIPPAPARAIAFTPARDVPATHAGGVVKVIVGYDRAFWRDRGLSGEAYQRRGVVRAVVDLCEPGGASPALLAFVVAREAARWGDRDVAERRAAVIDELAALFGDDARDATGLIEHDWSRVPWADGCVATAPPGALAAGPAWRATHGRVHTAGTEAATSWPGHMEGAIESGERAAAEVLAAT